MSLRAKALIAVMLSCALTWVLWFDLTRYSYQHAHQAGLFPNLHIKQHIASVFGGEEPDAPQTDEVQR